MPDITSFEDLVFCQRKLHPRSYAPSGVGPQSGQRIKRFLPCTGGLHHVLKFTATGRVAILSQGTRVHC
jgi:hypothetical protein